MKPLPDPYTGCNFVIEIEGLLAGGFAECSGLQVDLEPHEYREGGLNTHVHRFTGPARHPPLVLRRGLSSLDGLWNWHQDVVAGTVRRRNGTLFLLDHQRSPVTWWHFRDGLPVKWTGPQLRADAGAVAFESLEIVHHGLVRPRQAAAPAGPGAALAAGIDLVGGFF